MGPTHRATVMPWRSRHSGSPIGAVIAARARKIHEAPERKPGRCVVERNALLRDECPSAFRPLAIERKLDEIYPGCRLAPRIEKMSIPKSDIIATGKRQVLQRPILPDRAFEMRYGNELCQYVVDTNGHNALTHRSLAAVYAEGDAGFRIERVRVILSEY